MTFCYLETDVRLWINNFDISGQQPARSLVFGRIRDLLGPAVAENPDELVNEGLLPHLDRRQTDRPGVERKNFDGSFQLKNRRFFK